MSELLDAGLPWWGWALLVTGVIALVGVIGALFLPDWPRPPLTLGVGAEPGSDDFVEGVAAFLNSPVLRGGEVTVLQNGDAFYPAMLEAIRGARETVNFEAYIFEPDEVGLEFIEAFEERARAGVEVRLLVDWFGALKLKRAWRERLGAAGVRVERFRPLALRNLPRIYRRTHRRAIVVDGRVAFIGGAAVSRKWRGDVRTAHEWRDNMTRVTGPMVAGVQSAFAASWVYVTGEVLAGARYFPDEGATGSAKPRPGPCAVSVVSSPSDATQPMRILFWQSFANARRRLWICNSYFIPDRHLRAALTERARQGVDVRVLVPGNHTDAVPVQLAGRTYYEELLAAGVRVYEYRPAMMHAKVVVVDGVWSIVGSSNIDERSLEINEENALGIADPELARTLEQALEADFARSREIVLDEWRRRPLWQRAFERLAKVLAEQY